MNWINFKGKFHRSWHPYVKPFIESKECDTIYTFLKSQKGVEIAPKSTLTFRAFKQCLSDVNVVVFLEEPFCEKHEDIQYADGIPLSCEYVDKLHPQTEAFYDAMEKEFYGLNLTTLKEKDVDFYIKQGVLFLSSSLTVEVNVPGSHKSLWVPFTEHLIKNVFLKEGIPIVFCGKNIYEQYSSCLTNDHVYFTTDDSLSEAGIGIPWDTNFTFTFLNDMLEVSSNEEIMWVNMDVPF